MGTGHLLSTTTFDLPVWAVLCWLIARILRVGNDRLWLAVGLVAGPRRPFTSRWFWAGAVIAVLLWAPYLAWQAGHGWPELSVARSIANGGSGTSAPRWELLSYQLRSSARTWRRSGSPAWSVCCGAEHCAGAARSA
jgi:hypothetical protein